MANRLARPSRIDGWRSACPKQNGLRDELQTCSHGWVGILGFGENKTASSSKGEERPWETLLELVATRQLVGDYSRRWTKPRQKQVRQGSLFTPAVRISKICNIINQEHFPMNVFFATESGGRVSLAAAPCSLMRHGREACPCGWPWHVFPWGPTKGSTPCQGCC